MKRSVVNSIFFAVLFSTVINWAGFLIVREISLWNVLVIIILFILIKSQSYLYIKNDKTYFRRVPFFRGIPIEKINSVEDLRLLDSSSNIVNLWQLIKLKNKRQESYEYSMKRKLRVVSIQIALLFSLLCICFKVFCANSPQNNQATLTIAVASNFHFPLSTLIKQSDYWTSQPIRLVTASSGTLYAQITKGAPFDLFFSADAKRPQNLEAQSLAANRQTYAQGKLVLWPTSEVSLQKFYIGNSINVRGKFAIANPQLAPFGVAAKAYIATLQNAQSITNKLVLGASVTQAFQFVDSGNAQFGLLAESTLIQARLTLSNSKYSQYGLIPIEAYPPITQQVVIISQSENKAVAQKFIDFVLSTPSQQQLSALGYTPVEEAIK